MSYDEVLHNDNLPNIYMMQFNSTICALSKCLNSVSVEKACIKKTCYLFILMYFHIALLNEKCTKCIYQLLNSNDIVPTASSGWNN